MKKYLITLIAATFLTTACVVPAFAHCHRESRQPVQTCTDVCESYCEDGILCGVDGHYCENHRDGDVCGGYEVCEPVHRRGHHHGRY